MNYDELACVLKNPIEANDCLDLPFSDGCIRVRSNSVALLDALDRYFDDFLGGLAQPKVKAKPAVVLELIETSTGTAPLPLMDWPRPADKGKKEAYADIDDARLLQKVRTGLLFLQGVERGLAVGPLLSNLNQVVNFINNQTISIWKRRDWALCHAAAIGGQHGVVAFAGFSGGGKSTLMLHLLAAGDYRFVSNDRLLLAPDNDEVTALGIAKMPRVNPGTLLNNPQLSHILPPERRRALCDLEEHTLWALEEKYDVPIGPTFGPDRTLEQGPLCAVVILNWHREDPNPTHLSPVQLDTNTHLLHALMKSAGPFYASTEATFLPASERLSPQPYQDVLQNVPVYTLSGTTDFTKGVALCQPLLDD